MENLELNTRWCQTLQILNATLKLNTSDMRGTKLAKEAKTNIKTSFTSFWRRGICKKPSKLEFYANTKTKFECDKYLDLPSFKHRQLLTKFLCSNHKLEIEKGRHIGTERANRICKVCSLGLIEDETHFLTACPAYTAIRLAILPSKNMTPFELIQQTEPETLARYLEAAYELQEDKLSTFQITHTSLCGMRIMIHKGKRGPANRQQNRLIALQVTNRTNNGLRFKIKKQNKKGTIYMSSDEIQTMSTSSLNRTSTQ